MRLNGWQRIGIVLSVLWFFVGGFWGNGIGLHEGDWAMNAYIFCLDHDTEPGMQTATQCSATFDKQWPEAIKYHWWEALIVAVVPIPIAWLLAYFGIWLFRWIRKGFAGA